MRVSCLAALADARPKRTRSSPLTPIDTGCIRSASSELSMVVFAGLM